MFASGGDLTFDARNDANNTSVNWLTVSRTGVNPNVVALNGTQVEFHVSAHAEPHGFFYDESADVRRLVLRDADTNATMNHGIEFQEADETPRGFIGYGFGSLTTLQLLNRFNDGQFLVRVLDGAGSARNIINAIPASNVMSFYDGSQSSVNCQVVTFANGSYTIRNEVTGPASLERAYTTADRGGLEEHFDFNGSLSMADPGNARFRLNSGTLSAVTQIAVDDSTISTFDFGDFFGAKLVPGDKIFITQKNDSTRWVIFEINATGSPVGGINDRGGWWQIPVTYVDGGGVLFAGNVECSWEFIMGIAVHPTVARLSGSPIPGAGSPLRINSDPLVLDNTLRIYGSPILSTRYGDISMVLNNLNFNAVGSPPRTRFQKDGVTKIAMNWATDTMFMETGMDLQIFGPTNSGDALFDHDDTDFNTTLSNTTHWNVTGADALFLSSDGAEQSVILNHSAAAAGEQTFKVKSVGGFFGIDLSNDDGTFGSSIFLVSRTANVVDDIKVFAGILDLRSGGEFRVSDSGNTDWVAFSHDDTDFNITSVNTTQINIAEIGTTVHLPSTDLSTTAPALRIGVGSPSFTDQVAQLSIINSADSTIALRNTVSGAEIWISAENPGVELAASGANFLDIIHNGNVAMEINTTNIDFIDLPLARTSWATLTDDNQGSTDLYVFSTASVIFMSPNGSIVIGGILQADDGRWLTIINAGAGPGSPPIADTITFEHEEVTASDAITRMLLPNGNDLVVGPNESITIVYDTVVSRWRCISTTANLS